MDEKIYAKYCPKCGDVAIYINKAQTQTQCRVCGHELKITPPEYDLSSEHIFSDEYREKEQRFIDEVIKLNPEFDQYLHEHKDEIREQKYQEYENMLNRAKTFNQQRSNVPKCHTCGSTNVEKISLASKAIGGALFGLFSSNVRNTMHCKNCGYKW